jgi:hypothetical protein
MPMTAATTMAPKTSQDFEAVLSQFATIAV